MSKADDNTMEVDTGATETDASKNPPVTPEKGVMASSSVSGSVTISVHPLVVMNVSEHWTRLRAQEGTKQRGLFK